jgi:hypothetical protein
MFVFRLITQTVAAPVAYAQPIAKVNIMNFVGWGMGIGK